MIATLSGLALVSAVIVTIGSSFLFISWLADKVFER